ncbi:MAG: DUF1585 domain-containing protein, partial [Planctomycetota bacterium]
RQLAAQESRIAETFVEKLLTFATGRHMGFSDRPEIDKIVEHASENGYRAKDLLHGAVSSTIFQSK